MKPTKESILSLLKETSLDVYAFLAGFAAAKFVLMTLEDVFRTTQNPNFKLSFPESVFEILVGTLFIVGERLYVYNIRSKRKVEAVIRDLSGNVNLSMQQYDEKLRDAILSDQITRQYHRLLQWNYSREIRQYINKIGESGKLATLANQIVQQMTDRIATKDDWYLVLHNFLLEEKNCVEKGNFNLLLGTYLDVYIEFIDMYMQRAKQEKKKFVVYSFTNAIPWDWFVGGEVGNIMIDFMNRKADRIEKMRASNCRMLMVTLTTTNKELFEYGFKDYESVRRDWLNTSDTNRQSYLNRLHTEPDSALIAKVKIDHLRFEDNLTEFIYFGLIDPEKDEIPQNIDWQVCIGGGFSSKNQFLLARFDLFSENPTPVARLAIHLENRRHKIPFGESLRPPDYLDVSLKQLPEYILNPKLNRDYVAIMKYKNIMNLAEKWNLAAKIWHTQKEAEEIKQFLQDHLKGKVKVLDAGCGTGFHTKILCDLKISQVVASDISDEELGILRNQPWAGSVRTVNADWRTLSETFPEEKFDGIVCLGTSIPYYKSWDDSDAQVPNEVTAFDEASVATVIAQFAAVLNADGILILGLSRHNEKSRTGVTVEFEEEAVEKKHKMKWRFEFDWQTRKRTWHSTIYTPAKDIIEFSIVGHLFDHEELMQSCEKSFAKVEIVDLDPQKRRHYDKYVVCRQPKTK